MVCRREEPIVAIYRGREVVERAVEERPWRGASGAPRVK
jgi:hypothetical protein